MIIARPHILIVEDDTAHAELIQLGFQRLDGDLRISHFVDGETALQYIEKNIDAGATPADWPKLILLDLNIPKIHGLHLLKTLKRSPHLSSIPVVIYTTSRSEKDRATAQQHGADGYYSKAWGFREMCMQFDDIFARWIA